MIAFSSISAKYLQKFEFIISQGIVATRLRWGGRWHMGFVANFIRFPAVQTFWESVEIWQSYTDFKGGNFFLRHSVVSFNWNETVIGIINFSHNWNLTVILKCTFAIKLVIELGFIFTTKMMKSWTVFYLIHNFVQNNYSSTWSSTLSSTRVLNSSTLCISIITDFIERFCFQLLYLWHYKSLIIIQ